ncbi:hypothetical protein GCM10007881_42570 [Mesorhizobium huakuii]|nr:hypothetical protein GCM10007881_42570 [Mesorhizobium huakuii]
MVTIVLGARGEIRAIGILRARAEQMPLLPVPADTLATQIAEVGAKRSGARGMTDDARLDDGAARPRGDEAVGLDAGALTVT